MMVTGENRSFRAATHRGVRRYSSDRLDFWAAIILLGLALLTPTTIFYLFGTPSHATGIVVGALFILSLGALGMIGRPSSAQLLGTVAVIGSVLVGLLWHALIASLFEPQDFGRTLASLVVFALMVMGAMALSFAVFELDDAATSRAITAFFVLLIVMGVASIVGIQPINVGGYVKRVFPFTEPSHYSLVFTPVLMAFCVNQSLRNRSVALIIALLIAYALKSLSLVVGVLLVSLICLPIIWIALGGVLLFAAVGMVDVSYFVDRLTLSDRSNNLSVLVYLQGWDLVGEALSRTRGWGLGFQQLGFGSINTYTSSLIVMLAGGDSNLKDGGFTLAKLVAELGVLGAALMAGFVAVVLRSAWRLRQVATRHERATVGTILALSFVSGYSVEALVRGIGYFSGTTMMMIAAMMFIMRRQALRRGQTANGIRGWPGAAAIRRGRGLFGLRQDGVGRRAQFRRKPLAQR